MEFPIPIAAVYKLDISAKKTDLGTELSVSGVYFNSAAAVRNIQTNIQGHSLLIQIFPRTPSKGTSGNIQLKILLPNNIDLVEFGEPEAVIWRRIK